jgi:ATP-dependent metalloprotease FtsH
MDEMDFMDDMDVGLVPRPTMTRLKLALPQLPSTLGGKFRKPAMQNPKHPKTRLILGLLGACLLLLGLALAASRREKSVPWPELKARIVAGEASKITLNKTGEGALEIRANSPAGKIRSQVIPEFETKLNEFLSQHGFHAVPQSASGDTAVWVTTLGSTLAMGAVLFAVFGGNLRSKTKLIKPGNRGFCDVAGIDEAKEELKEVVEFLRKPGRFERLGARIPKGVLLVGSPGTGKTLLAKAVAAEAGVPFFYACGADFVEKYLGVGPGRVRKAFKEARKAAPCILFIDEIDSVGGKRKSEESGGDKELANTLNAMLAEMDGMESKDGIVVIGATNRRSSLDDALVRPGRFDRIVEVPLPDRNGREAILKIHAKQVKLGEKTNLAKLAQTTPGFSGAELANILNEAALSAARRNKAEIGPDDLETARDKVRWGKPRESLAMNEAQKRIIAIHEAGHAIATLTNPDADPMHKVTIIPRGESLGSVMILPEEDQLMFGRKKCLAHLQILMAGRAAEELECDDITNGACGDLERATTIARQMVRNWGMGGSLLYVHDPESVGEACLEKCERRVSALLEEAMGQARAILVQHRLGLRNLAGELLEKETLSAEEAARASGLRPKEASEVVRFEQALEGTSQIPLDQAACSAGSSRAKSGAEEMKNDSAIAYTGAGFAVRI